MAHRADVIVIGAGVLGAFHAHFAARAGLSVLLLERNALPSDASVRNFGMVPQTIVDPESRWGEFARTTAGIYRSMQQQCDISVSERGSVYLGSTALEDRVLQEFAQRYGDRCRCVYLSADEVMRRYHFVHQSYVLGGLLFPDDLGFDPRIMLPRLLKYLRENGVTYVPHTAVHEVTAVGGECMVRTAAGDVFVGGHVFLCSGADAVTLFPEVLAGSGLRLCKLQMMRTVPLPGLILPPSILSGLSIRRYPAFASCPSHHLLLAEPMPDERLGEYGIHLLLKQEADGSLVIGDSHQYGSPADRSALTDRTDCTINEALLRYAQTMVRLPTWRLQSLWNGYYLVHDREPIFTATIEERIHLVTGIGGKGMSTAPGFAQHSVRTLLG